jgi:PAS domain S-box-containing protein
VLRILMLEDFAPDAELTSRTVASKLSVEVTVVKDRTGFLRELARSPDVILADYRVPGFGGDEALKVRNGFDPEIPFIFVSGTVGEEKAVSLLKEGATDYVWKDRLRRLPSAIERAVTSRREIDKHRRIEAASRRADRILAALSQVAAYFMRNAPLNGHLATAARMLGEAADVDAVRILHERPVSSSFEEAAYWSRLPETERDETITRSFDKASLPSAALDEVMGGAPFILEAGSPDLEIPDAFGSQGIVKLAGIPLIVSDAFWGMILFEQTTERNWSAIEIDAIRATAELIGSALGRSAVEAELSESMARFERLAENAPDLIYRYRLSPDRGFEYVSPAAERITGYPVEWFYRNDPFSDYRLLHPDDVEKVKTWEKDNTFLDPLEVRWLGADGLVIWTEQRALAIRDEQGQVVAQEGVIRDITARKATEEELRVSELRFRTLVSNLPDLVSRVDENMELTYLSPSVEVLFGAPADRFIGMNVREVPGVKGSPIESFAEKAASVFSDGTSRQFEFEFETPRGTAYFESRAVPELDEEGRVVSVLGITRDITDRREADLRLHQNMESLRTLDRQRRLLLAGWIRAQEDERRRLASDLHDDSIQVMSAVAIRLQLMRQEIDELGSNPDLAALQQSVDDAIKRLRSMMFQLRPPALDRGGLTSALKVFAERLGREAKFTVKLDSHLSSEPPVDSRLVIYRIAQESVMNIRKHAEASHVLIELGDHNGGSLIRITDDGRGFDATQVRPSDSEHLGLSEMRERAELCGGWLHVESSPGAGTRVEFYIPADAPFEMAAS